VETSGWRSTSTFWAAGLLFTWLVTGVTVATAQTGTPAPRAGWREPLSRAEMALANGEMRQAEQAWEDARRAAIRSRLPHALLEVGVAYLSIGEATRDRQTAIAGARQLFLLSLFRARARRDADGIAAAGQAFASLGDCDVAERVHAVVLTMATKRGDPPTCVRSDPSASPRQDPIVRPAATAPAGPQAR
jgi:hypothetical protein